MGLPGRVWVSKEIEWQRNISTLPQEIYLRVQYAKKAKLKTSLGIPVLEKGEVIVVLVFYMTDEARTEDQYLIDLVSAATAQLGAVLQSKRAEEVMRIQSAALEASPNGIVITDSAGRITWANPAFAQLTGYSMQEIRGENPRVLKSGQHSRDFYTGIWQKILSGESWQGEIVNRRKDGSLYTEEQSITPVRNSDGEITHFIAIKQDITQRKQAEEKIQQQNTFLNNVIESIASPFYVINTADYSIEIANSAARALGVDRLNTCFALTHGRETPCDGQEHPCPLKVVQETKRPITVEHTHFTAEGKLIWVEVHGYPILNESGDVLQMIEYTLDITARKMAEKALQESQAELERSEARYRLLADNSTDVIWTMGLDMRFTYISPSVRLHRGYTVDEAMSLSLEETLPPDSFQKVVSIMTNALADIKKLPLEERPMAAQTVEMENYCKDGSTMWVEATISFLLDPDGDPVGVLGVSRDITKRKQAEDELRKLSRAVEQSGSTIVVTDLEGNIEFANPAFTRITGYTLDEIIGVNTRILSSGKHPPEFYQDLWGTITRGDVWHGEMINRKKNGELYWESATISPVQTPDGKTTHYLAIKEDITERKAIEAALLQEQEKTDALLKNILPATVAEEIKRTGSVTPVLFENVSILFTDFTDFTTMAEEIPPQELVKLIDHYFSFFDFIVKKYNLEKLKTIGDSYMCAGGLPTPSARHAVDITYAALDFMNFVQLEKEERQRQGLPYWDMRIGISSGPVVAGIVGHIKYNYDVWGDTVVMAARMEQSGKPGRVNISKTTYDLIKDHFDCQYRGTVRAKHKGLVEMYFVNGPLSR
jgi:PAS domain S-box-containing protein